MAVGGAAGSLARTALGAALAGQDATALTVNLTGSLALGLLTGLVGTTRPRLSALLGTGFLGGWTTFSAVSLIMVSDPLDHLLWLAFTLIGSVALAWSGIRLGRLLRSRS